MSWLPWIARWLSYLTWAAWVGGFMFYGAIVVPILHDHLDSLEAGGITREATNWLNLLGLACLATWALGLVVARSAWPAPATRLAVCAWLVSALLLLALFGLHRTMDQRLDAGALSDFYPLHRLYLRLSTAQWLSNLVLSASYVTGWSRGPKAGRRERTRVAAEACLDEAAELAVMGRFRPRGDP